MLVSRVVSAMLGVASICVTMLCPFAPHAVHAQSPVLRPRVVIVSYFEVGNDTGDRPGELQLWVERDHLDRSLSVPGMPHAVRANADGSEIAVVVGPGNLAPAVNLMALGADPRFDLRESFWLINGIAGVSPQDGTLGSAFWTDFVVNGDLAKEIDGREKPDTWPDGFFSLDADVPSDPKGSTGWEDDVSHWQGSAAKANRRGNVIRLNGNLLRWAYTLTKNTKLPESEAMRNLRLRYKGFAGTTRGPQVAIGANLATEIFWHGQLLDAWAHRWVTYETDGVAHLGTTPARCLRCTPLPYKARPIGIGCSCFAPPATSTCLHPA